MEKLEYQILDDVKDAYSWVFSTFLRGYKSAAPLSAFVASKDYYSQYHAKLERALKRFHLVVAAAPDSDDDFFGWALGRTGLLWYVHTKPVYRRQGVADTLIHRVIDSPRHIEIKHLTPAGSEVLAHIAGRVWHLTE